jgi:hypothetical protein
MKRNLYIKPSLGGVSSDIKEMIVQTNEISLTTATIGTGLANYEAIRTFTIDLLDAQDGDVWEFETICYRPGTGGGSGSFRIGIFHALDLNNLDPTDTTSNFRIDITQHSVSGRTRGGIYRRYWIDGGKFYGTTYTNENVQGGQLWDVYTGYEQTFGFDIPNDGQMHFWIGFARNYSTGGAGIRNEYFIARRIRKEI